MTDSVTMAIRSLPSFVTSLVGRSGEIAAVIAALGDDRLVALTGAGGVGKSRLAAAIGTELAQRFGERVWWVDLAPLHVGADVAAAIRASLGANEGGMLPAVELIEERLGEHPALLILDNCEHLVESVSTVVAQLVQRCPELTVLMTSREPLGLTGEVAWRVPPLAVPPSDQIEAVTQYDAVLLFLDRARRVRPTLQLDDGQIAAIAEICARLDGIPLAIELAAARCRQLSPQRIAHELHNRFRLLTNADRTALARQRTMLASVEWSFGLLEDTERSVLRRLAIFNGPFTLDAAEAIAAAPGDLDRWAVLDVVSRLVDKSLVQLSERRTNRQVLVTEYRLLETIRHFALDQVVGDDVTALRDAHANWWLAELERLDARQPSWAVLDLVSHHRHDIGAALDWLDGDVDPARRLPLLALVAFAWVWAGYVEDQLPYIDRWLLPGPPPGHETAWAVACAACGDPIFTAERTGLMDRAAEIVELVSAAGDARALIAGNNFWSRATGTDLEQLADIVVHSDATDLLWTYGPFVVLTLSRSDPTAAARWWPQIAERATGADVPNQTFAFVFANEPRLQNPADPLGMAGPNVTLPPPPTPGDELFVLDRLIIHVSFAWSAFHSGEPTALDRAVNALTTYSTSRAWGGALVAINSLYRLLDGTPITSHEMLPTAAVARVCGPTAGYALARATLAAGDHAASRQVRHFLDGVGAPTVGGPIIDAALALHEDRVLDAATHLFRAVDAQWSYPWEDLGPDLLELAAVVSQRTGDAERAGVFAEVAGRCRSSLGIAYRYADQQRWLADIVAGPPNDLSAPDALRLFERGRGENRRAIAGWDSVTPSERAVIELVVEGLSNPQIADRLVMGRETVKTHLSSVYGKLGLHNRTELAAAWHRRS